MARPVLPAAVTADLQSEDYYETTVAQPLASVDTDIYPDVMPAYEQCFGVIDPEGDAPEMVFWTSKGANYVRCPSATDGEGRGVFQTTPQDWPAGTKFGIYSVSAYLEAIVTGVAMQDGFLQARHFSSAIDPNSWQGTGESWTYGASTGNKEFTYVISGDKTTKYTPGMRLQLPRVTASGYTCTDLEAGSSQYASKTSPAGVSFTDDFTIEAWVKLESYGGTYNIASRYDGSDGFRLYVNTTGQVAIYGDGASTREFTTSNALPLGLWVHVAATLDMSGAAATIYFDGILIPNTSTGAAGTSLTQAGNLQVGAANGANFFDGKISDVRIWSVVRTAQNVLDNMHKRLVGDETNLVAYFKLAGDFVDSTANANTLTASGSATATAADSPFAATEYGIVTGVVFATGNTTITLYTGQNLAPAENLSNVSYSGSKIPVGFPSDPARWTIVTRSAADRTTTSATYATLTDALVLPVGAWKLCLRATVYHTNSSSATRTVNITLSSDTSTETNPRTTLNLSSNTAAYPNVAITMTSPDADVLTTAATTFTLLGKISSSTNSTFAVQGSTNLPTVIRAVCGYL